MGTREVFWQPGTQITVRNIVWYGHGTLQICGV
jgi:hypothetical protein